MAKPSTSIEPADIFAAARTANLVATRAFLDAGAEPAAVNDHGFTALECAAMGTNGTPTEQHLAVLRLLIEAGSPLEHQGGGGVCAYRPGRDRDAYGVRAPPCDGSGRARRLPA